ncbi:ketoacyl-ACP synthase III [Metabacillus niabensis]|uniref:ketoacyl-ACP synthase III n=1 Tax=Metabacillus niabensis TaxID=324854 RepID=UPI001CFAA44C|nr:ketoacyl-ACP synthase III [Metabacillus niabensis]
MQYVKIHSVDIYHPTKVVDNTYFINHFQQREKDITRFLDHMGRKKRYFIDNPDENSLTMAIEAAKRVLTRAKMSGKDIDLIMFSSQIPEYTFPTNATYLHDAIGAGSQTILLDSNANCAGMTVAVDYTSRYMLTSKNIKTALIVGSDYNSIISDPEDEITFSNYGDAAAAVILEKTDVETGFIDSIYFTDSINKDKILYPAKGLTNVLKNKEPGKYIKWLPFDGNIALPPTYEMIQKLLDRHNLQASDISCYCFSQFSLANILKIQEKFDIHDKQIVYVGDRFGYTGTSSPFLALHEAINRGTVKRGDYILFWTIGSGYQLVSMLFKY